MDHLTPFSDSESARLKSELAAFLQCKSLPGSVHVEPFQPFLLDCWEGLCRLTGDPDGGLPTLLRNGVPTGVLEPIESSHVAFFRPCEGDEPAAGFPSAWRSVHCER